MGLFNVPKKKIEMWDNVKRLRDVRAPEAVFDEVRDIMNRANVSLEQSHDAFPLLRPSIELYKTREMEGWCWEMSAVHACLAGDRDVVKRGVLGGFYSHGWIELNRGRGSNYVFDPALKITCDKGTYYKHLSPKHVVTVPAGKVKKCFIDLESMPEDKKYRFKYCPNRDGFTIHHGAMQKWRAPIFRGCYEFKLTRPAENEISAVDVYCHATDG